MTKDIFLHSLPCAKAKTCPYYEKEEYSGKVRVKYNFKVFEPIIDKKYGFLPPTETFNLYQEYHEKMMAWITYQDKCNNIEDMYGVFIGCALPGDISTKELYDIFNEFVRRYYK